MSSLILFSLITLQSPFLTGQTFALELRSFLIGQTFTLWTWFGQFNELQRSCVWGPKHFAQHALGTILQVWWTCHLTGWNLKALPWKRKKLGQQHMANGVNVFSLLLQRKWPHLWTCGRVSVICRTQQMQTTKWVRNTAMASIAEAFSREGTIGGS